MADAVAAVQAGGGDPAVAGDQQAPGATNIWTVLKGLAFRMLVIYFISSMIRGWNKPQNANSTATQTTRPPAHNLFAKGMEFDLFVYLSDSATSVDFGDDAKLFWAEKALQYGDWTSGPSNDGVYMHSEQLETTPQLRNNGSMYAHVFLVRSGASPDANNPKYDKRFAIHKVKQLNKFRRKRYQKTANLLTGESEQSPEDLRKAEIMKSEVISHWHPNLTINLIEDYTGWTEGALPPPLDEYIHFDKTGMAYYPILFLNDYWNLASDYTPLNDTVTHVNLSLTYAPMSLFKWQLYASQTMRNKWSAMLGGEMFGEEHSDDDQDSIKQALLETNPILLGVTIVVSLLHTVFEFLAFKNDIQFWRSRKSLEGLSVRSVVFSCFTSLIVLLYVLDNDTNFVVKISVGIGMLIEMWKIPKCMNVSIDRENKWFGVVPRLVLTDKGSYVESSTKEYDQLAFKYLSWVLYPLLVAYAVYSLMYHEHRGWYSFVLSMLYGFLLTFGFIMMTPQLFINYKLKSVAHLPWRMLTYKFINTFIDDLFAFVIRMPTMYRIGCFRDDIIFLIYVYQRWIYRVDPTRVNEFGTTGVDHGQPAPIDDGAAAGSQANGRPPGEAGDGDDTSQDDESKKDK